MNDRKIILAGAFLRALATGMIGVLIGIHLARHGFGPAAIGSVISAGLAGATVASALVTFGGDRFGRRRTLIVLSLLGGVGGLIVAVAPDAWVVGAAAFLGMLNGMGRDRGASSILDQAVLPATASDKGRTAAFAAYNVVQDVGHALGALAAGILVLIRATTTLAEGDALRVAVGIYALLLASTAILVAVIAAFCAILGTETVPSEREPGTQLAPSLSADVRRG